MTSRPEPAQDTVFTKVITRQLPATIHYEDDQFIVIDDIAPQAPVHVLLITKEPYESLEKIALENQGLHAAILQTARKVTALLKINDNYKLFMNVGPQVQAVPHFHMHIMGGWGRDMSAEPVG